jgi:hypothetical protein
MELNKVYQYIDTRFSPIVGYLNIIPASGFKEMLEAIQNKSNIMYDYFGFEYEDDDTLTFYDFTSPNEKSINISIVDLIGLIDPITKDYVVNNPSESLLIEGIINKINQC